METSNQIKLYLLNMKYILGGGGVNASSLTLLIFFVCVCCSAGCANQILYWTNLLKDNFI